MRSVAVIGSGAAGLSAALAAAYGGARVTVYERGETVGGTTALSGGNVWLPAHGALEDDSPELALRSLALGDYDDELAATFAAEAGGAAARVEALTQLRWQPLPYPDYHSEFDGGRSQGGRTLEPKPFAADERVARLVRPAPNISAPVTYAELVSGEIDREALAQRAAQGVLTLGRALLAALLEACLDAGVTLSTGVRVRERPDADAVVLASGGFERDEGLVRSFLRGPMLCPVGAPGTEGDGLRIAMREGAALGSMSEAWWCAATRLPGETIEGAPLSRLLLTERARPGCIVVDRSGRRFGNEAQNYNDYGRSLQDFDASAYAFAHVPAWMVFDGSYRRSYRLGPLARKDPDPPWLARGQTPEQLAQAIGVPPEALRTSIERFNEHAELGVDPDFGRGSFAYDRFIGALGPLREGPYYGLELLPGCLGTKGGPRTDANGRVLSVEDGEPIGGLYAAGNVAASALGMAYPGAGGTLGQAVVFGLRAGDAAAGD
ncbi:MAG: FAD-dependent oxidoreductase [Solirubrobacteraceae bacterium]